MQSSDLLTRSKCEALSSAVKSIEADLIQRSVPRSATVPNNVASDEQLSLPQSASR